MQIEIDQEILRESVAGNINRNPVALAMAKAGWQEPTVQLHKNGFMYTGYTPNGRYEQMMLPKAIREWLMKFESGFSVDPVSFECPAKLLDS